MIVAPIEAIIAQQKPKKFILSNEGPNTKKRPAKVDKKRLLTNLDIFSLSTTIEYNNTCMGYVQNINIAKLTSIYFTAINNPDVKSIEPNVINKKSTIFFL